MLRYFLGALSSIWPLLGRELAPESEPKFEASALDEPLSLPAHRPLPMDAKPGAPGVRAESSTAPGTSTGELLQARALPVVFQYP